MDNYKQFLDFIFSDSGKHDDLFHVIDLIATNKPISSVSRNIFKIFIDDLPS